MNHIEVSIGGRQYKMAVQEGQEHRVKAVAAQFDDFVRQVKTSAGDIERDRLLVLAAMMLSDELLSMQSEKDTMEQSMTKLHNTLAARLEKLAAH